MLLLHAAENIKLLYTWPELAVGPGQKPYRKDANMDEDLAVKSKGWNWS
jgi:hypothetical protein